MGGVGGGAACLLERGDVRGRCPRAACRRGLRHQIVAAKRTEWPYGTSSGCPSGEASIQDVAPAGDTDLGRHAGEHTARLSIGVRHAPALRPSPIRTVTVVSGITPDLPRLIAQLAGSAPWAPYRRSGITPCPEGLSHVRMRGGVSRRGRSIHVHDVEIIPLDNRV